ncbi:hypothetical protein CCUS01_14134 [Colletotrichum cuscutae]|uniref:Uncharacterized protein n=1 Tax=Colletotrichum cuscutae TaxID=1209917 RepID=A0AAJ0DMA0_9PEZI|nr:hypothetical protein CCUS01_14134 [Colletotrichum cuscutae]
MRWGNTSNSSELMFSQAGGLLHTMSSVLLLGASDEASCTAVDMVPTDTNDAEQTQLGLLISKGPADARINAADVKMYRDALAWYLTLSRFAHTLPAAERDVGLYFVFQMAYGLPQSIDTLPPCGLSRADPSPYRLLFRQKPLEGH